MNGKPIDVTSKEVMGQHCGKCYRVCLEDWTYCPFCGAQERYGMPMRCKPVPRFSDETTVHLAQHGHFWTVEELNDGKWCRSAQGHAWALERDARQQCEQLRRRYGGRIYRVTEYGSSEKASASPPVCEVCGAPNCHPNEH